MSALAVAAMSASFIGSLAIRAMLACIGRRSQPRLETAADGDLPVYSVLVPLYHEAAMLPQLIRALESLDYPTHKLDILLVVEEDDEETLAGAEQCSPFEIVVVPFCTPRTKPKACNYALQFARGEYVVVYDAEDRPEADQLRKAVAAFRGNPEIACFQARLEIDRPNGWLAAMGRLDYGIWFRTLLPGLSRLHAPIPLGGTSNHFRLSDLRAANAWDPFNVTEDADLGIRLSRLHYRVAMLDSSTFEEAPTQFGPWYRQRTRWLKGYMQTLLVHTRRPTRLAQDIGARGCLLFQVFLGGAVWSALVNPILWAVFAFSCFGHPLEPQLPEIIARISGGALLAANVLLAALSLVGTDRRFSLAHLPSALTYPFFWLLISAAAYRAIWQLLHDPFKWEKTPHIGSGT
jgi:cellulose synthase/poly-beta-1,6-N-acetylglucosamine synthase-like glycosyltransferase